MLAYTMLAGVHTVLPLSANAMGSPHTEKGHAFGKRAKQAASDLAFGIEVTVQTHGPHKYKRTFGDVILPDGMSLNQELVKEGWC